MLYNRPRKYPLEISWSKHISNETSLASFTDSCYITLTPINRLAIINNDYSSYHIDDNIIVNTSRLDTIILKNSDCSSISNIIDGINISMNNLNKQKIENNDYSGKLFDDSVISINK